LADRTASIYSTADEINALPEKFRQYIHDLVSRCDKSGDVQTIAILREDRGIAEARRRIGSADKAADSPEPDRVAAFLLKEKKPRSIPWLST
jgi:hypothetical protein